MGRACNKKCIGLEKGRGQGVSSCTAIQVRLLCVRTEMCLLCDVCASIFAGIIIVVKCFSTSTLIQIQYKNKLTRTKITKNAFCIMVHGKMLLDLSKKQHEPEESNVLM